MGVLSGLNTLLRCNGVFFIYMSSNEHYIDICFKQNVRNYLLLVIYSYVVRYVALDKTDTIQPDTPSDRKNEVKLSKLLLE
jgi:hypothetical protein